MATLYRRVRQKGGFRWTLVEFGELMASTTMEQTNKENDTLSIEIGGHRVDFTYADLEKITDNYKKVELMRERRRDGDAFDKMAG